MSKKYVAKWQIAYAARKLRKDNVVTITCLKSETPSIIEMLKAFSNSNPILNKIINKPDSQDVLVEIVNP